MAYSEYDSRYSYLPRHEYSSEPSRDTNAHYSGYLQSKSHAMRAGYNEPAGSYHPAPYYSYEPSYTAPPPERDYGYPRYRADTRRNRWPPSPSAEDETASLAREVSSSAGSAVEDEAKSRGTVDQYPIIEEIQIQQPTNDERRFVLVSDPSDDDVPQHAARDRRRKSVADRGGMAHLKTDLADTNSPLFTQRTPSPYAYTKPQKESLAPSAGEFFLSPESIAPPSSSIPNREARTARDQNAKPVQVPVRPKHKESSRPSSPARNRHDDVFEDSDGDSDHSHLRTERRPARYSFVKGELQKEHVRTNVLDSQPKPERRKRDSFSRTDIRRDAYAAGGKGSNSSGSSKQHTPASDSPRSSNSSLNAETRKKSKPSALDTGHSRSSKYAYSRPSSPRPVDEPSRPDPPPRQPSLNTSKPSSSSGRAPSPLSSSYTQTHHSSRAPATDADRHSTYPPTTERSRPATRPDRYETIPIPTPHINVKSPSPARANQSKTPLPYPLDDRPADAFMPPEEQYQHDHSYASYTPVTSSPRPNRLDSPKLDSPRDRHSGLRPSNSRQNTAEEMPRSPRVRSNSQTSNDGARKERKTNVPLSLDRPLPSCPRAQLTEKYNDWYTLQGCSTFDVCPSCYEGVFADTPFGVYFSQTRRFERPEERICDFASPWMRLAWLLTIKQRRQSLDLLYALADITARERPCPGDRELGTDHTVWYGVPDPRDGSHVTNFALCPSDLANVEALFPTLKGYFTRLPTIASPYSLPPAYTCSLRVKSRRFPKYLDLLVELDAEAQSFGQHPDIQRFVKLARENAFKTECQRDKVLVRKPWHFIPALPEFTVCQECFEECIWPYLAPASSSLSSSASPAIAGPAIIPKLFHRTIQPVPDEDPDLGSSCCLYSTRMRKVWERAVREEDFGYLEKKALERKRAEVRLGRERREILGWMDGLGRGGYEWERARGELVGNEERWRGWE